MVETEPQIYLINRPQIDWDAVETYLDSVGGRSWLSRKMSAEMAPFGVHPGEDLTEFAGRLCYRSWEPGLNANIRKIRTDRMAYFANILSSGHGSVLEHANFSFVFHNVSRVFTHELVRHRAGVAISQESLRYVRLTEIGFRIPNILSAEGCTETEDAMTNQIINIVESIEDFQRSAVKRFNLDDPNSNFPYKKEVTSALRRIAPMGLSTDIMWTANLRTIRHVINMRTAEGAEEEMKLVFGLVAVMMAKECPMLFQDMKIGPNGVVSFDYPKV